MLYYYMWFLKKKENERFPAYLKILIFLFECKIELFLKVLEIIFWIVANRFFNKNIKIFYNRYKVTKLIREFSKNRILYEELRYVPLYSMIFNNI